MPDSGTSRDELTGQLEMETLRALVETWRDINATFFRSVLRRPVFELADSATALGRWVKQHRVLEISRTLLLEHGWGVVVEVLKHEMAHQFVDEVLRITSETAHGPAFRDVCRARGFDGRAQGIPESGQVSGDKARILERVSKLLALAESPNVHEAQAAALAAQKLMLKYNIECLSKRESLGYIFRHLGKPTGRVSDAERVLASLLSDHFFVEVIWVPVWRPLEGKSGSVLEVCGTPENVELAAYTHAFLMHTAERLWRDFKRQEGLRKDAGRRSYLSGVMAGFKQKLKEQQTHQAQEGLVWVGDAELGEYFHTRHPRIRWTTRRGSSLDASTYYHGEEAGRNIVLHRGVSHGPSSETKLLTRG